MFYKMNQNKIAKFSKVSFEQYLEDFVRLFPEIDVSSQYILNKIRKQYDNIKLPKRATEQSAGYDFYSPISFNLYKPHSEFHEKEAEITISTGIRAEITIPTGIRCQMNGSYVLLCFPRSSLGFKYKIMFANTIPVIDADYYFANNEGHIMLKLVNHGDGFVTIKEGDRFAQGIFLPYGITMDDDVTEQRVGGIGSTNK